MIDPQETGLPGECGAACPQCARPEDELLADVFTAARAAHDTISRPGWHCPKTHEQIQSAYADLREAVRLLRRAAEGVR